MCNCERARFQSGAYRFDAIDLVCVFLLVAYFLYFAIPSLSGGFNVDEMANLYVHWRVGMLKSLWANVCFWKGPGRPGGALYYLPLYHFFSLNPQPYRVAQISIVTVSIPMVYYLASLLAHSRSVAFLGILAFCYHAQLSNLVFIGSFIYDVLCGFFYFAALTYYVHIRAKGRELRFAELVAFLTLYICALNSKEMAITLPVIVLAYEALRCRRFGEWKQFVRHNWRFAIPGLVAGLLTVPYIYGKTMGPNALANFLPYRPLYSWHRFITNNAEFVNQLLYLYHVFFPKGILVVFPIAVLLLWTAVFVYAYARRDRGLRLMACWIVIVPLPLAFIPLRGGACLYLLLFGWAMIFGELASDLITVISKLPIVVSQGVAAAAGRRLDSIVLLIRTWATILVAAVLAMFTQWENQRFDHIRALLSVGQKTAHVIQAFRSLHLHPAFGSKILLEPENRFYQNAYYPAFVASLVWNDRSLSIYVDGERQALSIGLFGFEAGRLPEQQIATMDYIISFDEFKAELICAPDRTGLNTFPRSQQSSVTPHL